MSNGLIALPPQPASPRGSTVEAGDFWPAIDVNAMRDRMRVGTGVTDARLRAAIVGGVLSVTRELTLWKALRIAEGHERLDQVPGQERIDDMSSLEALWLRAVEGNAMAQLVEVHRDIGAAQEGAVRAEELAAQADSYRRDGTHAVRDILGTTRTSIGLI